MRAEGHWYPSSSPRGAQVTSTLPGEGGHWGSHDCMKSLRIPHQLQWKGDTQEPGSWRE